MSCSLLGKRFCATASWFISAKPKSCFLLEKFTGINELPKAFSASQQICLPKPEESPAACTERSSRMKVNSIRQMNDHCLRNPPVQMSAKGSMSCHIQRENPRLWRGVHLGH